MASLMSKACGGRGMLQSGLGRLGLGTRKAAAHLEQYDAVLVYVVGGISMADMRAFTAGCQAQEATDQGRPAPEVLLGGTALLSPDDVVQHLLG